MQHPISLVIPTLNRAEILLDTLQALLGLPDRAVEILVVDQTPVPPAAVASQLSAWDRAGTIRWLRLPEPSIPVAMNCGLLQAKSPLVLFVDDDVVPAADLIRAHAAAYARPAVWAVAGQVLQPGEEPRDEQPRGPRDGLRADLEFPFYSTRPDWVRSVMAGNLSVRRERALAIGGFDENFVRVAYRFETEFCRRIWRCGGRVRYEPAASLRHLRAGSGGTRQYADHLRSASPAHGVGDYYFALRQGLSPGLLWYLFQRPLREVRTRFHLRHPWYIPIKLLGEARACAWAVRLWRQGPRYPA